MEAFGGVAVVAPSGAMGSKSDFEITMAVGKRLHRSVFYCTNISTLLKLRAITELFLEICSLLNRIPNFLVFICVKRPHI